MKREIKFRGICRISGKMIYGDLIHGVGHKKGKVYILPLIKNLAHIEHCDPLDGVEVIPETVGQFTSLTDKNGKEIYFDSDLFNLSFLTECEKGEHSITSTSDLHGKKYEKRVSANFILTLKNGIEPYFYNEQYDHWIPYWVHKKELEVIGNKYENNEMQTT